MIATNMLGAEIAKVGAQITPSDVRVRRRSALTISRPTARMTHFPSRAYHARGWFVSVGVPSPTGRRLLAGVVSQREAAAANLRSVVSYSFPEATGRHSSTLRRRKACSTYTESASRI